MSRFIDKLNLPRTGPQPIGFKRAQAASAKPKIQLVASLAEESVEGLADYVAGADAGLLRISRPSSSAKALKELSQAAADIPWGGWLKGSTRGGIEPIKKAGGDFVVFPAEKTPLAVLQSEVGIILEVDSTLAEGLLRAVNELPIDAVLIAAEKEGGQLTWQHLMLFRRFADLLNKPLLVSTPAKVTSDELQALWDAGVGGVVVEVTPGQPQERLKELRQIIDKLVFPSPRPREKAEPLLPRISKEPSLATIEEEEEE